MVLRDVTRGKEVNTCIGMAVAPSDLEMSCTYSDEDDDVDYDGTIQPYQFEPTVNDLSPHSQSQSSDTDSEGDTTTSVRQQDTTWFVK